ncbi:unnamed protein product [Mucor hiemalis]
MINSMEESDFAPYKYYNLGFVLLEPTHYEYYKDNIELNVMLLHAQALARDPEVLFEVLRSIYLYVHQFPFTTFELHLQDLSTNAMSNEDIRFMKSMIESYNNNSSGEMIKLLKCDTEEEAVNSLKDIIFLDVRFARLLTLFHMLCSDKPKKTTASFERVNSLHSNSNGREDKFFGYGLMREDSFSIPCKEIVELDTVNKVELSPSDNNEITSSQLTDYHALSTQELVARVESSGYKEASRNQMIENLQQRYQREKDTFNVTVHTKVAIEKCIIENKCELWNSITTFKVSSY